MSNQSTSATIGHDRKGACASGAGMTRGSPRLLRHPDPCPAAYEALARTRPDLTSSPPWIRGHWQIENGLHWVRDEVLGEDRSTIRTGHAPQNLAALRNGALSWLRAGGIDKISVTLRSFARDSLQLFTKLGYQN